MAKRTTSSKPPTSSPIAAAGAGFRANSGSLELASWASRLNGPPHSPQAAFAPGSPGRARVQQALDMRDARRDDEGTPHTGPLALSAPSRDLIARALGMRDARLDDEGTPHSSPLALGSPGRERIGQALDTRNAREDDNGTPSQRATFNLQRRQTRDAGKGAAPVLSPSQSADFKVASQHFADTHMQGHAPDQQQGAPRKGWSPQARIGSYNARHPGGANVPYGGDPTQAPDYVEPSKPKK
jgi:hypothetical protein